MKAHDSEVSCLPAGLGRDSHPPGMLHQQHWSILAENGFASSQPRLARSQQRAGVTHAVFFWDRSPKGPLSRWLLPVIYHLLLCILKYADPNNARI